MRFTNPVGQIDADYSDPITNYASIRCISGLYTSTPVELLPILPMSPPVGYLIYSIGLSIDCGSTNAVGQVFTTSDEVHWNLIHAIICGVNTSIYGLFDVPIYGIQLPTNTGVYVAAQNGAAMTATVAYSLGSPPF